MDKYSTVLQFSETQLNDALLLFVTSLCEIADEQMIAVMLSGSILFDDLAPGYGDLDFLVVMKDEVTEHLVEQFALLRERLRSTQNIYLDMLEGDFITRRMLQPDQQDVILSWGSRGEHARIGQLPRGFAVHLLREKGQVLWGHDIRCEIPPVTFYELLADAEHLCRSMRRYGRGGTLHAIDWLFTVARLLYWITEGDIGSKTQAADWGTVHASGSWKYHLQRAKELRACPAQYAMPETRQWLGELTEPISTWDFDPFDSRVATKRAQDADSLDDPEGESLDDIMEFGKRWAERHSMKKLAKADLKNHAAKGCKTELLYEGILFAGKMPYDSGYTIAYRILDKASGLETGILRFHWEKLSFGSAYSPNRENRAKLNDSM